MPEPIEKAATQNMFYEENGKHVRTKKKILDNDRIDLLKMGLSGIAKRYGYQTVQDFYRDYHAAKNAYVSYQEKAAKWEETYGTKAKRDIMHDRIQNYQREKSAQQSERVTQQKTKGRDKGTGEVQGRFVVIGVIYDIIQY